MRSQITFHSIKVIFMNTTVIKFSISYIRFSKTGVLRYNIIA